MHDVRWVIGETIESTLPQLKSQWIGRSQGLHVDSYKMIKFVDGYRVSVIAKEKVNNNENNKLWFVNLGGYKEGEMLEQHHLEIVVASTAQIAKKKARNRWSEAINQIHKDDQAAIIHLDKYLIYLEPDPKGRNDGMEPDWSGYWVIT